MEEMSRSTASLPGELLVEILPLRCVSPSWRALCSDPGLLRRSPQTHSCFFCHGFTGLRDMRFLSFPCGSSDRRPLVDPSLPFPCHGGYTHGFRLVDCCGGLLCECFTSPSSPSDVDYIVCSLATEDWVVLPHTEELHSRNIILLGFVPADPSCFVIFVILQDCSNAGELTGVEIYLSENRTWTSKQSGWPQETRVDDYKDSISLFMDGILYLITDDSSVVTVDTDGKTWRKISRPYHDQGCIGSLGDACTQHRLITVVIVVAYSQFGFLKMLMETGP